MNLGFNWKTTNEKLRMDTKEMEEKEQSGNTGDVKETDRTAELKLFDESEIWKEEMERPTPYQEGRESMKKEILDKLEERRAGLIFYSTGGKVSQALNIEFNTIINEINKL